MKTLGKHCKEKGITLTLLIEKSGVQKGTLESRWKLGKQKEIDCLIRGAKIHDDDRHECCFNLDMNGVCFVCQKKVD